MVLQARTANPITRKLATASNFLFENSRRPHKSAEVAINAVTAINRKTIQGAPWGKPPDRNISRRKSTAVVAVDTY
jgi:hypothetical protein